MAEKTTHPMRFERGGWPESHFPLWIGWVVPLVLLICVLWLIVAGPAWIGR